MYLLQLARKLELLLPAIYILHSFFPMPTSGSLTDTWDCHVHCFEPDRFPYKTARAYTPKAAPLNALIQNLLTDNVMLVQASIEQDSTGLLAKLEEYHGALYNFSGLIRGTILADNTTRLSTLSDKEFKRMHLLGVRSIRLHGSYGGSGSDLDWVQREMKALACLRPVREYGWSVSAQLPLKTWSGLKPFILTNPQLSNATIVADHIASSVPADYGTSALEDFTDLLKSGRFYVKISALHRRSPGDIQAMKSIVSLLAQVAPQALLWGSDWPHVDTSHNDIEAGPIEGVNAADELAAVKSWLSEEQMRYMLVDNPRRVFGT
jgi:predicted TIM-barrel fold metal-dependent hydrolase